MKFLENKMILNLAIRSIILIGLFIKVIVGQDSERYRCPSHLSRTIYLKAYNNKCYRFEKTEIKWVSARDTCSGEQGHLIEIRNQATQNWVVTTLNDLSWSTNGVWIGAHDIDENDVWTWVTGDTLTWNYWAPGQPNCNWFCLEYCANLRRDDSNRWHDKHCDAFYSTYSYICQYDMGPATTTTLEPNTTTRTTTTTTPTTVTTTSTASTTSTTTSTVTTTPIVTTSSSIKTSTTPTTNATTTLTTRLSTTPSTSATTTSTTSASTASSSSVVTTTVHVSTSPSNQSYTGMSKDEVIEAGALSGVIVACVLGALALVLVAGVCFYRSRKKKGQDNLAVYFDNIIYTVRTGESRMRGQEQNLNNHLPTANQNEYADINECGGYSNPPTTKEKEHNQYSEIADLSNLSVRLPKYEKDDYLKCNIAKSKLVNKDAAQYLDADDSKPTDKDTSQYLDAFEGNPGLYESTTDDVCNSMNEQLESSRNCYDECGYVGQGDNSQNHYVDVSDNIRDGTADGQSPQSQSEHGIYEECANKSEQPSSINDIWENFDGTLDLSKTVAGYNNNTYNINT